MGMSLRCRGSKAEGYGCSPVLVASRVVRGRAGHAASVVVVLLFRHRALHDVVVWCQSHRGSCCCTTLLRLECPTPFVSWFDSGLTLETESEKEKQEDVCLGSLEGRQQLLTLPTKLRYQLESSALFLDPNVFCCKV